MTARIKVTRCKFGTACMSRNDYHWIATCWPDDGGWHWEEADFDTHTEAMDAACKHLQEHHAAASCGPHRAPEGPCEDLGICMSCGSPTFAMRPPGECFGRHAEDCSLPERHEGICVGGGSGHGEPKLLRGMDDFTWKAKGAVDE